MTMNQFKRCPGCNHWISLDDILEARGVEATGLMADPKDSDDCLFHFVHRVDECNTSFVIHSREFVETMGLDICGVHAMGGPECPGHCTSVDDLTECDVPCSIQGLRELMLSIVMKNHAPVE